VFLDPTVNLYRFATDACNLLASYNPGAEPIDYQEFADLMTNFCSTKNVAKSNTDTITDIETLRNNFCTIVGKPDFANCPDTAKKEQQFDLWEEYCAAMG
uniref:Uncharacterized protein n=1 Tax=Romanomermis culicivorax TaxID=13658 RepID=A0A915I3Q2_ROMCU